METKDISRRSFLGSAGLATAAAMACAAPLSAVASADEAAGEQVPSWLGTAPDIDPSKIVETYDTDLVIAGAGNGGLAAASFAADNGVDFMIFEANDINASTKNWFAAVDTRLYTDMGVHVDRQRIMGEVARYSAGSADQRLVKMFMDESNDMFEYVMTVLEAHGATCVTQDFEMPLGMGGTPYYTPGWEHMSTTTEKDGLDRNSAFAANIEEKGGEIKYNHRLVKLVTDETGAVTGAIFQTGDDTYAQANAKKAVLLATGGYVNNTAMLSALSPITCQNVVMTTSEPKNDGMGQKAAMWAGAVRDTVSATMIFDRGFVEPGVSAGFDPESPADGAPIWPSSVQFNACSNPWLKVNIHGERFCNESCDYDHIAHAAAQQPTGTYYCVWDGDFAENVNRFNMLGCAGLTKIMLANFKNDDGTYDLDGFFDLPIQGMGDVLKADTLEELADLMLFEGQDKENFLATVERYNELFDKQEDEDFYKEPYRLSAIRKPPFYAAHTGGRLLTSLDGIRINADCQALNKDYEPIAGLYCCGDCSGSVFAGCYPDQLHGFACGRTMTEALHVVKLVMEM